MMKGNRINCGRGFGPLSRSMNDIMALMKQDLEQAIFEYSQLLQRL